MAQASSGTLNVTFPSDTDMISQSGMEGGVREQFEIIEELAASLG